MYNTIVIILMALLVALSTGLAAATIAPRTDESQTSHPPLCSRAAITSPWISQPLEQEMTRFAAKMYADHCSSSDLATLGENELVNYLQTHSRNCLADVLWTFDDNMPAIFTNQNMQAVLKTIEALVPTYDGTNATGLHQLWFFVRIGYYHAFYEDEIPSFNRETIRAHVSASKAFAASDHFYDLNDEAANILDDWFTVADQDQVRQHHLVEVKRVLSGLTSERATSNAQLRAYNRVFFLIFRGIVNRDQGFMDALSRDTEIVDILLQATGYDFLYPDNEYLLENAIRELGRLAAVNALEETVIAALLSILPNYERLSGPFMVLVENLEDRVSCDTWNICRDVLESEIIARAFPHTYRFDDGAVVFETSLNLETVQPLYYAAKEVKAQFHRLLETDKAVAGDVNDVLYIKIYGTKAEYERFQGYVFDLNTNNGGIYIEQDATLYTYQRTRDESIFTLEELFRHEYVHYLAGRFLHPGLWGQTNIYQDCRLPWLDEGLAEFLAGSTSAQGVLVRQNMVSGIANDETRLDTKQIFQSCYSDGFKFYRYGSLFFNFMHQQRRIPLLELLDEIRHGNTAGYDALIASWSADSQMAFEYDAFLDEEVALLGQLINPTTSFLWPAASTSDNAAEIENALQLIDGDLDLDCQSVATQLNPRFGCTGSLSVPAPFSEDRGASNEYLNTRLDRLINAAIDDGAISNFEAMTCYFTNNLLDANYSFSSLFSALAGESSDSLPYADLYCEGPLRPAGIALDQDGDGVENDQDDFPTNPLAWSDGDGDGVIDPEEVEFPDGDLDGDGISNLLEFQYGTDAMDYYSIPTRVDLKADLRNDSPGELVTNSERPLMLYTGLRFSQGVASNVLLAWSASLPLRLEEVYISEYSVPCETVETNEQTGTINCGNIQDRFKDLVDLWLIFTPLQAGTLDFTIEFSADELEINPADNVRSLQLEIAPDPARALTELPDSDQLAQNAPNPFNSQTVLSYFLHAPGPTRVEVFALSGQRVAVLHRGPQQVGSYHLRWNGRDDAGRPVASGMYLYRLVTDEVVLMRKLLLLR